STPVSPAVTMPRIAARADPCPAPLAGTSSRPSARKTAERDEAIRVAVPSMRPPSALSCAGRHYEYGRWPFATRRLHRGRLTRVVRWRGRQHPAPARERAGAGNVNASTPAERVADRVPAHRPLDGPLLLREIRYSAQVQRAGARAT